MAINIPAVTVVSTKMADGTVQMQFQNGNGGVRFCAVFPAADFTSINTNVNGGSAGDSESHSYTQDQNRNDYPSGMTFGV